MTGSSRTCFRGPVFASSAKIFRLAGGEGRNKVDRLGDCGATAPCRSYAEKEGESQLGSYRTHGGSIEVLPGPESYHSPEPATITATDGAVSAINSRTSGDLEAYERRPGTPGSLFDAEQRSKRQLVKYDNIPKVVVEAVTAIEDRRFFQHGGVNFMRLVEAAWVDFTHQRHQQGGSTITMQLSRAFF